MKTTNLLWISILMLLTIVSCSKTTASKEIKENTICVKAETIIETSAAVTIDCSGLLSSKRISKLSFMTGGIVNHLLVEEGSFVKKGDLLASLDLTEISAQVQQANVAFEKASRDLKRAKNLYADTVVTLEQLQNANSAYEAALETKNIAEFNMRYSKIVAPANGKIIGKLAEENELTAPGMPIFVFSEQGNDDWIIKTGLSDKDIVTVKNGDKAVITFDAFPEKQFEAEITQMSESVDPTSGTFEVGLSIKPSETKFINGLVASIKIISSNMRNVSLLPSEAVTEADGKKGFVYVVNDKNETARKVPITISFIHNSKIAVLEPLNKIGKIITKGAMYLEDGSKITVIQ